MTILVCCDKFKGSIDALAVCQHIANGINQYDSSISVQKVPIADGGDGTLDIIAGVTNANIKTIDTTDALGRSIDSRYLIGEGWHLIELAEASGLQRLNHAELDVMSTTTIGTGTLIKHAIDHGATQIILGLGGSCTNDAGLGILYGLGFKFLDSDDKLLSPRGGNLLDIKRIVPVQYDHISFRILCDVTNPLYGPQGAAHIYGPQKNASPNQIEYLDTGLRHIAQCINDMTGKDVSDMTGFGAAGGVAAGMYGLLDNVTVESGFDFVAQAVDMDNKIGQADVVITGEGHLDLQSTQGKVIGRISEKCQHYNKKLLAVVGKNSLTQSQLSNCHISNCYSILDMTNDESLAMNKPGLFLEDIGYKIGSQLSKLN